jgi:TIR domain
MKRVAHLIKSSPTIPMSQPAVEIFFSYAHEDEALRDQFAMHLRPLQRQGVIKVWHDRNIKAGEEWDKEVDRHLESADIILLLISANFLASDYCYGIELQRALERHDRNEARVIPIIFRSVDWQNSLFGKLSALPTDGKPITSWSDQDEAFTNVIRELRRVIAIPKSINNKYPMSQINTNISNGWQVNVSGGTVNITPPNPRQKALEVIDPPST